MSRYEDRQEVADKISYEGGIHDMLFGYGLSVGDLPEDEELKNALAKIKKLQPEIEDAIFEFEQLLPEPGDW